MEYIHPIKVRLHAPKYVIDCGLFSVIEKIIQQKEKREENRVVIVCSGYVNFF